VGYTQPIIREQDGDNTQQSTWHKETHTASRGLTPNMTKTQAQAVDSHRTSGHQPKNSQTDFTEP